MDSRGVCALALIAALVVAGAVGVLWVESRAADRAGAAEGQRSAERHRDLSRTLATLSAKAGELEGALTSLEASVGRVASRVDVLEAQVARVAQAAKPEEPDPARPRQPQPLPRDGRVTEIFHDDFEKAMPGWMVPPLFPGITGVISLAKGRDVAKNGEGAMKLAYTYQQGKVALAIRILGTAKGVARVSVWARCTNGVAHLFLGASEADFSNYAAMRTLAAADGWRQLTADLAEMQLVPDSQDENNVLDLDQVVSLSIGDAGAFLGREGENAVLLDDFRAFRVEPKPQDDF